MESPPRQRAIVPRGTVLPPPPPGVRYVPVVFLGIVISDDPLRARVDNFFHVPMIVLALLFLPLFGIEHLAKEYLAGDLEATVRFWTLIGALSIAFAFLVEFVTKVTIAESRFEYCRRNWLDIVIICLPFLRLFRVARLARTVRVFRLRGVGMKLLRHVLTLVVGLKYTERLLDRIGLHVGPHRMDPTKMTRMQIIDEIRKLRKAVDAWEGWFKAYQQFAAKHDGFEPLPAKPETPDMSEFEEPVPTVSTEPARDREAAKPRGLTPAPAEKG
jgi:hypothetical protein